MDNFIDKEINIYSSTSDRFKNIENSFKESLKTVSEKIEKNNQHINVINETLGHQQNEYMHNIRKVNEQLEDMRYKRKNDNRELEIYLTREKYDNNEKFEKLELMNKIFIFLLVFFYIMIIWISVRYVSIVDKYNTLIDTYIEDTIDEENINNDIYSENYVKN